MMSVGGDIVSSGGNGGASGGNVTTNISIPIEQQQQQSPPAQATNANHSTQSHANAIQSKMSDILKRKAPPKRKSQTSSRSKTRNQEHHTEQSSSVMQELMSKASALGKLHLPNRFNSIYSILLELRPETITVSIRFVQVHRAVAHHRLHRVQ